MKTYICLGLELFLVGSLVSCGNSRKHTDRSLSKEAWDEANKPQHLGDSYVVALDKLPKSGETEGKPWSDTYWPSYKGGIANRWNSSVPVDSFQYKFNSLEELKKLSSEQLSELSPAEKYDIFIGNYEYSLAKYERERNHANDETWFGLCHGWAPAALAFKEPKPVTLKSPDGIEIPFGSSDVKALLTFIEQYPPTAGAERYVSDRCNEDIHANPEHANDPACRDVNAGTFHIVIANQLGLLKQGFVADVRRDIQVWNHPIYSFSSETISETNEVYPSAAAGTVKIAKIETTMTYIAEIGAHWEAVPLEEFPSQVVTKRYTYNIELNAQGDIIGGEWLGDDRPDFLWIKDAPKFTDYFKEAAEIYTSSIAAH